MIKPIYLYITPFFPSPKSWRGGYCFDAVKAIIRDGRYDVRIMVVGKGADYEWDGVKVSRFHRISAPSGIFPFVLEGLNNWVFVRKLKILGIKPQDVAVCHVNTLDCGQYAAFFKRINPLAKSIIQLHSSYSFHLDSGRLGIIPIHATMLYFYYRRICRDVDILAFVSDMSRRTFGKRYVSTPEGSIKDVRSLLLLGKFLPSLDLPKQMVVYNGIDKSLFFPKKTIPHRGFVIGCVANFQPLKDHITLLKAVNILKDKIGGLKVRLIGSGATLNDCKKYVKEHKLQEIVSFEKEIDHRELPDFYRSLDLFVLPSRLEGFVCVCVESWACGTPTIFCKNISLSELVSQSDYEKWLFKPMEEADLAAKILAYKENKWEQNFNVDLEINTIWRTFLDDLKK
jgi:glycosyltransferase involved in cell wall biosynthesis